MDDLTIVTFENTRQINYFCNEIESYFKKFQCRLRISKENEDNNYPASLLSMLRMGTNISIKISIEGHNQSNINECKKSIERWFLNNGNN